MIVHLNPHTPKGNLSEIRNLMKSSQLTLEQINEKIQLKILDYEHMRIKIEAVMNAWFTDLLAIINQLGDIKSLCSQYPRVQKILYVSPLPYSIIDNNTGYPIINQEFIKVHNITIKDHRSLYEKTFSKHISDFQVQFLRERETKDDKYQNLLWFVDKKWAKQLDRLNEYQTTPHLQIYISQKTVTVTLSNISKIKKKLIEQETGKLKLDGNSNIDNLDSNNSISTFATNIISIAKNILFEKFQFLDSERLETVLMDTFHNSWNKYQKLVQFLKKLLQILSPEQVILWNDWYPPGRLVSYLSKQINIKTLTFQHGMFLYEPIYFLSNSDQYFLFSQVEANKLHWYLKNSNQKVVFHQIGYPVSHQLYSIGGKEAEEDKEFDILVMLQLLHLTPEFYQLLDMIEQLSNDIPTLKILVRPHPRDQNAAIIKNITSSSNIEVSDTHTLAQDILAAKVIIGINSSALLEAALLGYKTLEYMPNGSHVSYLDEYRLEPKKFSSYDNLRKSLLELLQWPKYKKREAISLFVTYQQYIDTIHEILFNN